MSHMEVYLDEQETPPQESSTQNFTSSNSKSASTDEDYSVIDDVRINPTKMVFENAYEGKFYKMKLVIQNCGRKIAFVRMLPSNSSAFIFQAFKEPIAISPGMHITKNIHYKHCSTMAVLQAFSTMFINDKSFDYQFRVTLSSAIISVHPEHLDFGRIDAVNVATVRKLYIKNSGTKGTQFAIDLGRNNLDVIVDPMKGAIPAASKVAITVEIVGAEPGEFSEELWVKTTPPLRVLITGTFVEPKILSTTVGGLNFILVNFRQVYYCSERTKPLIIQNRSSTHSMYYVMAEVKGTSMSLEEARKIDDNYRQFSIHPEYGRVAAEKGGIVLLTFTPKHRRIRNENYACCFIRVMRLDCKDITDGALDEPNANVSPNLYSIGSTSSGQTVQTSNIELESSLDALDANLMRDENLEHLTFETHIKICLHGEKEQAAVIFQPDELHLLELTVNQSYDRVLQIQNASTILPITVKYRKIASVELFPCNFTLKPRGSVEIRVMVRATKMGPKFKKLTFDLYDGENLVSHQSIPINFVADSVALVKGRKCRQNVNCQDLQMYLESDLPFKQSEGEKKLKILNDSVYYDYIQNLMGKRLALKAFLESLKPQDYDITDKVQKFQRQLQCCKSCYAKPKTAKIISQFIPLTAKQLFYVKVWPKSIKLRKVAAFTSTTDMFSIENQNSFPVMILLKASKSCIHFDDEGRHVVASGKKKMITFFFASSNHGRYNVNIDVIVNGANVFQITVVAQVVAKTLNLDVTNISFNEDQPYAFVTLLNGLNAYTKFQWELPSDVNFDIHPREGVVVAERTITCLATPNFDPFLPNANEFSLVSESGQTKMLELVYQKKYRPVVFSSDKIDCGLLPLNIPIIKTLIMKNPSRLKIYFRVPNQNPIPGIEISPVCGYLEGKDSQKFTIEIKIMAVIEFTTKFAFKIDDFDTQEVEISGRVEFPRISIKPAHLQFRKMMPFSFHTLAFKIKNLSELGCHIKFLLDDLNELLVTSSEFDKTNKIDHFVIGKGEARILFLHFEPKHVCTLTLSLPFIINNILGPATQVAVTSLFLECYEAEYENSLGVTIIKGLPSQLPTQRLTACAFDRTVEFSSLNLNFVYFGENHYNNVLSRDFVITNCSADTIKICIRIDDLAPPFTLSPRQDENTLEDKNEDDAEEEEGSQNENLEGSQNENLEGSQNENVEGSQNESLEGSQNENVEGSQNANLEYFVDVSYVVTLEPEGKFVFEVTYAPSEISESTLRLPIFLRHGFDDNIFNYLQLSGVYDTPKMKPSSNFLYFEPGPYNIKNDIHFHITMYNHFENCEVYNISDSGFVSAVFHANKYEPTKGVVQLDGTVTLQASKDTSVDAKLSIECSCGASCTITATGVAEACSLVTHTFVVSVREKYGEAELNMMNQKLQDDDNAVQGTSSTSLTYETITRCMSRTHDTSYPFFPKETDTSVYADHMRSVLKTMENWMFTQVFRGVDYYKIPEGFTEFRVNVPDAKKITKIRFELPLGSLISYFIGMKHYRKINKHRELDSLNDEEAVMVYCFNVYSSILNLLYDLGAYLPNLYPSSLMTYRQYELYQRRRKTKAPPRFQDEETFYLFSKQCWLDLLLQVAKVFIINNINPPKKSRTSVIHERLSFYSVAGSAHLMRNNVDIYGFLEKCLIAWLESHCKRESKVLWTDLDLSDREVRYLDTDLQDGVVLGIVTAYYCPYATKYLQEMFVEPGTPEEYFHNACKLVQTWSMLKFSYKISPHSIVHPNMVEMTLLVSFLNDVLPTCKPREVVEIQTLLSEKREVEIEIYNCGTFPTEYEPIFFGEDTELFEAKAAVVRVPAGTRKTINISYHARCIQNSLVTLLLSGEGGQKFGKNLAVELAGISICNVAASEVKLKVPIYKVVSSKLSISAPVKREATYSLNCLDIRDGVKTIYSFEELERIKYKRQIQVETFHAYFDAKGQRTCSPVFCVFSPKPQETWIYYSNKEMGDFAVNFQVTPIISAEVYEDIYVELPRNYQTLKCSCKKDMGSAFNAFCLKVIKIDIPCTNSKLWNARKAMVLQCVTEEEALEFWKKKIFTPLGTRILTLLFNSDLHPLSKELPDSITYDVLPDKKPIFKTLPQFTIKNVISCESEKFPIHPVTNLEGKMSKLHLLSLDETEKRFYRVYFSSRPKMNNASTVQM